MDQGFISFYWSVTLKERIICTKERLVDETITSLIDLCVHIHTRDDEKNSYKFLWTSISLHYKPLNKQFSAEIDATWFCFFVQFTLWFLKKDPEALRRKKSFFGKAQRRLRYAFQRRLLIASPMSFPSLSLFSHLHEHVLRKLCNVLNKRANISLSWKLENWVSKQVLRLIINCVHFTDNFERSLKTH